MKKKALQLRYLHFPRAAPAPLDHWEPSRGFRLRIATPDVLVLTLGGLQADPLALAPEPQEESLILVPAPRGPRPEVLEQAIGLPRAESWSPAAILLLSDRQQLDPPLGRLEGPLRALARSCPWPVVWVLQEMPEGARRGLDFFNVERVLHQLGRIERRITRRAAWRRRLPW